MAVISLAKSTTLSFVGGNLLVYGTSHALVDAVCAFILMSLAAGGEFSATVGVLFLAYNFLAFAMQAPLGRILDDFAARSARAPRRFSQTGTALLLGALFLYKVAPGSAVFLAGLGNALFHLGGGVISLNLAPGRATCPGIFVAPGAVGLFVGGWLGNAGDASPLLFAVCVLAAAFCMEFVPVPAIAVPPASPEGQNLSALPPYLAIALPVALIFVSIVVRSYIGLSVGFPWKKDAFSLAFALAFAAGFGKALGGVLADRFGLTRTCTAALLASIPLVGAGYVWPVAGLVGILCFQMTMSVTLLAFVRIFPGRYGYAFGLACLALFVGSLPLLVRFEGFAWPEAAQWGQGAMAALSALFLYIGLNAAWKFPGRAR